MASQEDLLKLLANEEAPLHRNKIAEKLGESSYRPFQTQLDRLTKSGDLKVSSEHEYSITEAGLKKLSEEPKDTKMVEETNEELLGTTEYQQFISLGKMTGVSPSELLIQTGKHVWNGGDYTDLDWVARAFQEMGIRQDLRNRWWHSWRTYLHQPMPSQLPSAIVEKVDEGKEGKVKREGRGGRSYILDADDKPVYVGENLGDLYYEDALELAKIRSGRGRVTAGTPQTPGSMADEMVKLFGAFQQFMGDKAQGKSYMVRQGEEGMEVEEVEQGRPMILNYPQGDNNKQKPTFFVNPEGEVQEVQPGQPIIIKQPALAPVTGGVQYLIDKTTGQITQVQPGQPIVIQTQQPQQTPYTPIQMKDKDGNPMVLDLSTFIRLEEHKDKQRRDEDSHQVKMDIAKGFKEMLGKASSALSHVSEEK